MTENKKIKEYHIHITPEFLFDEFKIFKYNYTPWVYTLLKLRYNYFLHKAPNRTFKINTEELANIFVTTPQTIYNSINELISTGLLIKSNRRFQIVDEKLYLSKFLKVDVVNEKKYPKFIKFYEWVFTEILLDIKREILPMEECKRLIVKCLKLYFYLVTLNRHSIVFDDEPVVESTLTQTSLEKHLGNDHRVIKFLLNVLSNKGYIKLENKKIYTLNKRTYDPKKFEFLKFKKEEITTAHNKPVVEPKDETPKVPDDFIGYCKSWDGVYISQIYYTLNKKDICLRIWCKGDGIPPTDEESTVAESLKCSGKNSQYYKSDKYWDYKRESDIKKVA